VKTLAIDIGGTKFSIAGFDEFSVVLRESRDTNRDGGPEWMIDQFAQIVTEWRSRTGFRADVCGIGFGGPVDFPSQTVNFSTHVGGWNSFPLIARIQQIAKAPVVIDNDANVGALGEEAFGAGVGFDPLFYMTISTGIGGGIVSRGEVWRGADSYGGEIGHLTIQRNGPECLCGSHGCLERLCCGLWLERDYGRPAKELFLDPGFVGGYVGNLAQGLKAAIMLLNPARIVIGGGISKAGDRLFVPLRRELHAQITSWSRACLDVVPAALGDDSVLYGAYVLAQRIL
jgi:glucokinase